MNTMQWDEQAYIHRTIEKEYEEWLSNTGEFFLLTGAPKIGKSWFLGYIASHALHKGYCSISLSTPEIFSNEIADLQNITDKISSARDGKPFRITELQEAVPAARAENIITFLCKKPFRTKYLLLLDLQNVCKKRDLVDFLRPFVYTGRGGINDCVRVVVSSTVNIQSWFYYFGRSQENKTVELLPLDGKGKKQHEVYLNKKFSMSKTLNEELRKDKIKNYQWNHPFINWRLYLALSEQDGHPLKADDIKNCCLDVLSCLPDEKLAESLDTLQEITKILDKQWTLDILKKEIPSIDASGEIFGNLLEKRLIAREKNGVMYHVMPGLYELLLDLLDISA